MEHKADTTEIWRQMHERLLSYVRRQMPTIHDAEDIVQEVFVRIHANLDGLKDAQNVTTWVYQITRNVVADFYRQRATSAEAMARLVEQTDPPVASAPDEEAEGDIMRRAIADFSRCLEPMLAELPEEYRQAVILTELEGMTQKEAAEKLGLSVSGAKSRVQRGRGKLKDVVLACCEVELDRRGGLVDYHDKGVISGCDDCG
jgi:RNA polymerase sigma-70 factor (ECF subfamily)